MFVFLNCVMMRSANQGGRWGRWQWCWKVTPTLLSCWYLWASCGNHSDFWVAVIFLLRPKKLKPEVEKRIMLKQQQRQRAKAVSKLIVSGYRERGGSIISMLGVVQPPTSSDLFRSLQDELHTLTIRASTTIVGLSRFPCLSFPMQKEGASVNKPGEEAAWVCGASESCWFEVDMKLKRSSDIARLTGG